MTPTDVAHFEEFATATARSLRRTAYLMCGDWARAEDAAQDALVKVYAAWPRLERRSALRSYAHRAVTTAVIDQSRRPWRREHVADELPTPRETAPDATSHTENRMTVVAALRRLAPRQRACVVLRHVGDLSVEEVAEVLGIDAGTVKSQTARGLARLRAVLVELDPELGLILEDQS